MLYVYINNKLLLINCVYCVEVSGYDGERVIWELADNHVVEDPKENE